MTKRDILSGDWGLFSLSAFASLVPVGIPAIGGFVVVGQMLQEYGNCTKLY